MVSKERARELVFDRDHDLALSLSNGERFLLWRVLCYYNGVTISDGNGRYARLGIDRPLGLASLDHLRSSGDRFRAALASLQEKGIMKDESRYICRTEVPYCPTQRGRQVMDALFEPAWRAIYGDEDVGIRGEVETQSILHGEQNEGLLHRYMVMQAYHAFDAQEEYRLQLYPTGSGHRPDLIVERDGRPPMYWEAQTNHNAPRQAVDKYADWADRSANVEWIVPDGAAGRDLLRFCYGHTGYEFRLGTSFDRDADYSPSQLNEILHADGSWTPGMTQIWTPSTLRSKYIEPRYDAD